MAITCERNSDDLDETEDVKVLKGSCFLAFEIKQIDYAIIYLKFTGVLLCFIVALALMINTFKTCRNSEREATRRIFLTPFYFTRSTLHTVSSTANFQ